MPQVYDMDDKVGIGTNSPSHKLTIEEDANISSAVDGGQFVIRGKTNNNLRFALGINTDLGFAQIQAGNYQTSPFNLALQPAGGKVGMGTDSPSHLLTIEGDPQSGQWITDNGNAQLLLRSSIYPSLRLGMGIDPSSRNGKIQIAEYGVGALNLLLQPMGGYVGIGTDNPSHALDVCGTIRAEEIKVNLDGGCDFVFNNNYELMNLNELEMFLKDNKHLPEIATEQEMIKNGVNMKELQMKLLQKIEELTLYTINQEKKIIELEKQNQTIEELKKLVILQNEKIEKLESAIE